MRRGVTSKETSLNQKPSWRLENADALAASNKYTFYKTSRDLIAKVKPGEVVIHLLDEPSGTSFARDNRTGLFVRLEDRTA